MPAATVLPCHNYLTLTQAAVRADRCEDTVRLWIKRGRLKAYRLLGRTVVDVEHLDALLAAAAATGEDATAPK